MSQKIRHSPAPRSRAASSSSRLNEARRPRMTMATKLNEKEMCEMMIAPRFSGQAQRGRPGQDLGEEHQHGDAHADLRHHDGQAERALKRRLERESEAPEQERGHARPGPR